MTAIIKVESHPLLEARAFLTVFPKPLGEMPTPESLKEFFHLQAEAPLRSDDSVREAIRALLRHGGFKPAGRSKPSSEYLIRAMEQGALNSINLAVDVCNIVSLHSGLPISVVDADLAEEPFAIRVASAGSSYVFNVSGQAIDLSGLLCLYDAEGPCANSVKDCQRTKTTLNTTRTLTVIWGTKSLLHRAEQTERWYRGLLEEQQAATYAVNLVEFG